MGGLFSSAGEKGAAHLKDGLVRHGQAIEAAANSLKAGLLEFATQLARMLADALRATDVLCRVWIKAITDWVAKITGTVTTVTIFLVFVLWGFLYSEQTCPAGSSLTRCYLEAMANSLMWTSGLGIRFLLPLITVGSVIAAPLLPGAWKDVAIMSGFCSCIALFISLLLDKREIWALIWLTCSLGVLLSITEEGRRYMSAAANRIGVFWRNRIETMSILLQLVLGRLVQSVFHPRGFVQPSPTLAAIGFIALLTSSANTIAFIVRNPQTMGNLQQEILGATALLRTRPGTSASTIGLLLFGLALLCIATPAESLVWSMLDVTHLSGLLVISKAIALKDCFLLGNLVVFTTSLVLLVTSLGLRLLLLYLVVYVIHCALFIFGNVLSLWASSRALQGRVYTLIAGVLTCNIALRVATVVLR